MKKIKKINSRKDYENYKITQDIAKYFGEFTVDLNSKIKSSISTSDLFAISMILFFLYAFTTALCSKHYEKKKDN